MIYCRMQVSSLRKGVQYRARVRKESVRASGGGFLVWFNPLEADFALLNFGEVVFVTPGEGCVCVGECRRLEDRV